MPPVSMRQLLEAGVHFGHQTRRWNPKMKRFIFSERNGIYIIDLQQTMALLDDAYTFLRDTASKGGNILFVGTKKQAQEPVEQHANNCGMPYVNTRWLGGTLTNFSTIKKRIDRLQQLIDWEEQGMFDTLPKKEVLRMRHERDKLERHLWGIRDLTRLPDAVFVIDTRKEQIAVTEARRLGIPIVALVDTNCDPDEVDWVIPGNDDAIRAATLMCRVVSEAVMEGRSRLPSQVFEPDVEEEAEVALDDEQPVSTDDSGPAPEAAPPTDGATPAAEPTPPAETPTPAAAEATQPAEAEATPPAPSADDAQEATNA
ncbi:MAG TPA: 30S ribosomal protein S2 [Actinomycetota bacterium]|nr:30S ribosomal protein S2 [Actinomycetota bacterium]